MSSKSRNAVHDQLFKLLPHQDRVNIEMFRAIELLGKKLERVENERDSLAARLAQIEDITEVDEDSGKLSLPALTSAARVPAAAPVVHGSRWPAVASLMSAGLAVFAVVLVTFQRPPSQQLSPAQLAVLDALAKPEMARLQDKYWRRVDTSDAAPVETASTRPDSFESDTALQDDVSTQSAGVYTESDPSGTETTQSGVLAADEMVATPETVTAAIEEPATQAVAVAAQPPTTPTRTEAPSQQVETIRTAQKITDGLTADDRLPSNVKILETRAFEGLPEAQHDLATIYAAGDRVPQDFKRAAYWFNKASEQGIANADYNLGVMFQQGLGVRKDLTKAVGWYTRAAALGHPEAMYNLGIAYVEGIGAPRDAEQGIGWFKQAANAGVSQAAFNLGVLYESNFMGAADPDAALEWYQVAARSGHSDAQQSVTRIANSMLTDEQLMQLANGVEPAAGSESYSGQGDASPLDEEGRVTAPVFTSNLVAEIQEALVQKGLLPQGHTNGALDALTEDAIKAFQTAAGMPVDGLASHSVLVALQ